MERDRVPVCPRCGVRLRIAADGAVPAAARIDPAVFMALPFGTSSTARWVCPEHGDVGRVIVAVVDDHVEFVPIPAPS